MHAQAEGKKGRGNKKGFPINMSPKQEVAESDTIALREKKSLISKAPDASLPPGKGNVLVSVLKPWHTGTFVFLIYYVV